MNTPPIAWDEMDEDEQDAFWFWLRIRRPSEVKAARLARRQQEEDAAIEEALK